MNETENQPPEQEERRDRHVRNSWLRAIALLATLAAIAFVCFAACNDKSESSTPSTDPYAITGQGAIEAMECEKVTNVETAVLKAKDANDITTLEKWGLAENGKINEQALNGPVNEKNGSGDVLNRLKFAKITCDMQNVEATQADCPDGTPLTYDPNEQTNVKTGGVQNREEDLKAIKADPRTLAMRAHNLKLWDNPNNWRSLTTNEGKCLSKDGEIVYAKVEGALMASTTVVNENGVAPVNFYNTGMGPDGPLVNHTPGILGNRDAIVYTLADGTKVIVLKRCANLALPGAPKDYTPAHIPGSGGVPPETPPGTPPPGTTTPPPPGTTTPPPPEVKIPSRDPNPRGNAPQGGGPNATPGPGVQKPYTPPPAAPYTPPAPPAYTPPPAPPVVTQQPQPSGQPTPTVAPSTQPPKNSVEPVPGDFG